ncbi:MAG: hypothetical protein ACJAV7_001784 [Flavobacteriales bacterium]|jgi:hypothetical protein
MSSHMDLNSLYIAQTEETPEVSFNLEDSEFSIVGRSLPENAFSFYKPIIEWIRNYSELAVNPGSMTIRLDYFNSSSGRYIMEMLVELENFKKESSKLSIIWISDADDELMIEKGEEFQSLIDLPFLLKSV